MKLRINYPMASADEFYFGHLVIVISVSLGFPLLGPEIARLCKDNHVKILGIEYLEHCDKVSSITFELSEEQFTFLQLKYSHDN